jgi:hypothetical protein
MAYGDFRSLWSGVFGELSSIGGRAVAATTKPIAGAAVDRLLENGELGQILASPRLKAAVEQVLRSDGARQLVDVLFDSGLLDHVMDRLSASDRLWRLVDEVAASPAVAAAISEQSLGFADVVGEQARMRSRQADDWLERVARRVTHRRAPPLAAEPDVGA